MAKNPQQFVKEVVEQKNQKVTLTYHEFDSNLEYYKEINRVFEGVIGYSMGAQWIQIATKDGVTKVLPTAPIVEITITQE